MPTTALDADQLIHFACPFCDESLSVPTELAGVEGPCPSCDNSITAPASPPAPSQKARGKPAAETVEPPRRRTPTGPVSLPPDPQPAIPERPERPVERPIERPAANPGTSRRAAPSQPAPAPAPVPQQLPYVPHVPYDAYAVESSPSLANEERPKSPSFLSHPGAEKLPLFNKPAFLRVRGLIVIASVMVLFVVLWQMTQRGVFTKEIIKQPKPTSRGIEPQIGPGSPSVKPSEAAKAVADELDK